MTRREQYEAQQRRRSLVIAATSTAIVVAAIVVLVPMAPGWEKVQQSFFSGEVLVKTFPKLLDAFLVNVMIFAWSAPAIAVLGLLIALARDAKSPPRASPAMELSVHLGVFGVDLDLFGLCRRDFSIRHRFRSP